MKQLLFMAVFCDNRHALVSLRLFWRFPRRLPGQRSHMFLIALLAIIILFAVMVFLGYYGTSARR